MWFYFKSIIFGNVNIGGEETCMVFLMTHCITHTAIKENMWPFWSSLMIPHKNLDAELGLVRMNRFFKPDLFSIHAAPTIGQLFSWQKHCRRNLCRSTLSALLWDGDLFTNFVKKTISETYLWIPSSTFDDPFGAV